MQLPFHKVIEFANTKPQELERAFIEFFGLESPKPEEQQEAFPLFEEWLIYDFRQKSGTSFLAEYCLRNPHNLDEVAINRLAQAAKTAFHSEFTFVDDNPNQWIDLEDIFTGKMYRVWDSHTPPEEVTTQGTIHARIAQVEDNWYFVGSNPTFTNLAYTKRMKQTLLKAYREAGAPVHSTPKDTWELLKDHSGRPPLPPMPTKKELPALRQKVRETYASMQKEYNFSVPFDDVLQMIYEENSKGQFLDIMKTLIKRGVSPEVFFTNQQLFQDIWNLFPHRALGGKSPVEMLALHTRTK